MEDALLLCDVLWRLSPLPAAPLCRITRQQRHIQGAFPPHFLCAPPAAGEEPARSSLLRYHCDSDAHDMDDKMPQYRKTAVFL
ncbi:hypothetical protein GDO81_003735 [Engystomops pustulosus]|uniref:Secreted protein n=1 Tax=Engystomops pustulosus TaxID=76066 RepID=A0AAV6ZYR5_ENGPU|nr:hypothetical protein GDO81_003735 [Engystomops pustulosus]